MSSRRVRARKIYQVSEQNTHIRQSQVDVSFRSSSSKMRTISPRTLKTIIVLTIILLLLLLTSPKPPAPPGQSVQGVSSTSLQPINLNTVGGTIPQVNPIRDSEMGNNLKDKLKLK